MPFSLRKRHAVLATALGAGATLVPAGEAAAVGPVTNADRAIAPVTEMAVRAHARAVKRNVTLSHRHARLRGAEPQRTRGDVRDWSLAHLREENRHLQRSVRRLRRSVKARAAAAPRVPAHLEAIARCESGGDPSAVSASGAYRGKYQFDRQTWAAVGGSGDPAAAPEAEQDRRAAMLYARSGATPWPVCGG